jgi:hypothetical protein
MVYPQQIRKIPNEILQQDPEAVAVARQLEARDRAVGRFGAKDGELMIGGKTGLKW